MARVRTLEQANRYVEQEFLPWWNRTCTVLPRHATDAHRPLARTHDLAAILSHVEQRLVLRDYTFQFRRKRYQIAPAAIWPGLRGSNVRIELRLDGSMHVCFAGRYLAFALCDQPVVAAAAPIALPPRSTPVRKSNWMQGFFEKPAPPIWTLREP